MTKKRKNPGGCHCKDTPKIAISPMPDFLDPDNPFELKIMLARIQDTLNLLIEEYNEKL